MCRSTGSKPFDCISRFCVYRIYKRIGISYYDGTSAYSSVTHAPRHIVASELRKVDFKKAIHSHLIFLRHKSKKSIDSYT